MKKMLQLLLVSLTTAILTLSISTFAEKDKISDKIQEREVDQYKLFRKIIGITKKNYVEEVEEKDLFYSAFDGMLRSLDPHSGFLNPDDYKEMGVQTKGEFGGVGIEITMDQGFLKVVSPIDDTPAYEAGLKTGDYITKIDGESIRDLNINKAVQKIRGPKGTKVTLTIVRKGMAEPFDVELKRSTIKIASVKSKQIQDDIGYFRITAFSENTSISLKSQYKKLKAKMNDNIKGIVIDLRNNPGGLLNQAVGVSELFLDGGTVVSTKGRSADSEEIFSAASGDISNDTPIVVLINQGSASASEIVAGAFQDHNRAVVIGEKSFGKGSVQSLVPLGKKLGMRITTSKYYTPSGASIQAKGIEPDIIVTEASVKMRDSKRYFSEESLSGHLETQEDKPDILEKEKKSKDDKENKYADISELYETDYQLARAVDLLHAISALRK